MMKPTTFSKLNTCMAWLVFAIAAIVYGMTVEPTASLWDCPEFIASGYKLEIGHPPGAPVFMLAANLFSHLANDTSKVALMVNLLSALLSAGCIFFLFLTITHLTQRILRDMTTANVIIIEACGMVGALAYTFSDTFWFSAVEAEVYAFSSFLTALMFWLILKWSDEVVHRRTFALSVMPARYVVHRLLSSGQADYMAWNHENTLGWGLACWHHPLWTHTWCGDHWRLV